MRLDGTSDEKAICAKNMQHLSPRVCGEMARLVPSDSSPLATSSLLYDCIRNGLQVAADNAATKFADIESRVAELEVFASQSSAITDDILDELGCIRGEVN